MRISLALLIGGILSGIVSSTLYYLRGYHHGILGLFLASLFLTGAYFFLKRTRKKSQFNKYDIAAVAILLLIFAPLYLAFVYTIPWQVGADEVTIMKVAKEVSSQKMTDIFGISGYLGHPNFVFLIIGILGKMIGGINLFHMRAIHATFGLAIIILSYLFLRTMLPRWHAFAGAVIVGSNHALFGISRMAMRDNSGLLIEVGALTLLMIGLRKRCPWHTFLGGLVAGLSFYIYFPGRITIGIWALFLLLAGWLCRREVQFRDVIKLGLISLLGIAMIATPVSLATTKEYDKAFSHLHNELLFFPQARELQKPWYSAQSVEEGFKKTLLYGITAFNNDIVDHGWIYINPNHGFLDPLTGILIWIGLVIIALSFKRNSQKTSDLLAMTGFILIWLFFTFITGKSPYYTRLLVSLPFVAYLAVRSISFISEALGNHFTIKRAKIAKTCTFILFITAIVLWNAAMFADYEKGFDKNDDIGGTARYIEARKGIANYTFYVVESDQYTYYVWGMKWHEFFVDPTQQSIIIPPESAIESIGQPPFTIFTSESGWKLFENQTRNLYPNLNIQNIKADGSLLAIEAT